LAVDGFLQIGNQMCGERLNLRLCRLTSDDDGLAGRRGRGKTGVQTVYDVFAVAPLGARVVDPTRGSIFTRRLGSPWCAGGYHWLMPIATTGSIFPKSISPYLAFKELHRDPAQPEQA
jgi:hypothetical protein